MSRHDPALAQRLYAQPNPYDLVADFRNIGDGLYAACAELTRTPSCSNCDELLRQLRAAEHSVTRLRVRLAEGGDT